ncbi:hypothetical protein [Candidatus Parabeggiatoa sp. HSG14]|uniref:hypothetical protein n=1 Tax=Candidatus Parabeggiatoa sp. HSG14 TaxID=3055593 RepID=UPI0025A8FA7C|nr:hypothetical protein [Thiotrichales bacterium HSG14]
MSFARASDDINKFIQAAEAVTIGEPHWRIYKYLLVPPVPPVAIHIQPLSGLKPIGN